MNIFTLPGPTFLLLYAIFGVVVLLLLHRYLSAQHADLRVDITTFAKDPYKIAYLRGGQNEAIHVATVSLQDRGLLQWDNNELHTSRPEAVQSVNRPIEKAILSFYLASTEPATRPNNAALKVACDAYKRELGHAGLLATADVYGQRIMPFLIALAMLVGVAWAKVHVALSHGHRNLGFLIILALVFVLIAAAFTGRRTTAAGRQLLANLRVLFALLKQRAKKLRSGGETNEVALIAAVFGLSVLSAKEFPLIDKLRQSADSGSSSSCSSSGSSCGSSCGGGCGGCGS